MRLERERCPPYESDFVEKRLAMVATRIELAWSLVKLTLGANETVRTSTEVAMWICEIVGAGAIVLARL